MKKNTRTALLRGVLCAAAVSSPLWAADSADSGAGTFYALVLGLMATLFGGFAFCYGLVWLGERVVQKFQRRHAAPGLARPLDRAA